jgi:hypothetical protein
MADLIHQKKKGHYEDCLRVLSPTSKALHDIDKDVNRTFPGHPYFNIENRGTIG